MQRVYLALGSNLAAPVHQVNSALQALSEMPQTTLVCCSPFYRTRPMGPQDQPDYLNAVAALDTQLSPDAFLDCTQAIEQAQGRERKEERWGPRTLDLDILLFGTQQLNTERLTIPHYGLKVREFMLYPLADIAPDLIFPDGTVLKMLLEQTPPNGMTRWA